VRIVVEGNFSPEGSYGIVNLHLAEQLARRGHRVAVVGFDIPREDLKRVVASHSNIPLDTEEPRDGVDVRIRQMWPPVWGHRGGEQLVIIQPWEFGSIPLSWLPGVRDTDAIWVPSEYCKRGYLQSGIDAAKVWVVPNGVELADEWVTTEPTHEVRPPGSLARLLFLGGTIMRKGIDVLIAALDQLDDATLSCLELTIKEVGADSYYLNQSLLGQALEHHPRVAPRVRVEQRHLRRDELLKLIASSDVLVHPYRSEGFGLGVLEAMAVGTPVIHTRGGATNEFCGPGESLLIPATLVVPETARVGEEILADRSYWYEPSVEGLRDIVAQVVHGEVNLEQMANAAHERARGWGWDRAGDAAARALEAMAEGRGPDDELTRLESDLANSLSRGFTGAATLMSRLAVVGDIASAGEFASLVESRRDVRERTQLSSVRERLAQMSVNTPDVWSGAPFRSLIAAAQRQRSGYFAYAHDFEGGDHATYEIAQRLSGYLGSCHSILDIACGQGSMLRVCRARGQGVQGIEADPELVRQLRADGFRVYEGFVPDDLSSIHVEPFDGVFVGHLVEHLQPRECQALLSWIFDNIADGGTIVIQTPDFTTSAVALENFWLDATHVRPYPVRLLKAMLSTSGFVPVEGACGPVRDVAPLDVIAVGRRVARSSFSSGDVARGERRDPLVGHVALFSGTSGFAHAARSLFSPVQLASRGVDLLRIDVSAAGDQMTPGDAVELRALRDVEFDVAVLDLPLGWIPPVSALIRARYRVARTTFEATPIPYDLRMTLSGFDEVWCFSHYDAQILMDSGVSSDVVHVVAPGIDVVDPLAVIEARGHLHRERFTFLSVFNFEPRKNPDALLRAFATVAALQHQCDLVLKVSGVTPADVEAWLQRTLSPAQGECVRGRIRVITELISSEALSRLYLESDVFVLPTRGEGYGIPFLEALAHGLATICPDVGGHRDFCSEANSLLVATSSVPAGVVAGAGVFRESYWRDVDEDDLVRAMSAAVTGGEELERLGRHGLRDAARLSLDACRDTSQGRLGELLAAARSATTIVA